MHRHTKGEFRLFHYWTILSGQLGCALFYSIIFGARYILFFAVGMTFSWTFEFLFGAGYEWATGQKLWKYRHFPVAGGHLSLVTPPFWGFATVLFIRIIEMLGIINV